MNQQEERKKRQEQADAALASRQQSTGFNARMPMGVIPHAERRRIEAETAAQEAAQQPGLLDSILRTDVGNKAPATAAAVPTAHKAGQPSPGIPTAGITPTNSHVSAGFIDPSLIVLPADQYDFEYSDDDSDSSSDETDSEFSDSANEHATKRKHKHRDKAAAEKTKPSDSDPHGTSAHINGNKSLAKFYAKTDLIDFFTEKADFEPTVDATGIYPYQAETASYRLVTPSTEHTHTSSAGHSMVQTQAGITVKHKAVSEAERKKPEYQPGLKQSYFDAIMQMIANGVTHFEVDHADTKTLDTLYTLIHCAETDLQSFMPGLPKFKVSLNHAGASYDKPNVMPEVKALYDQLQPAFFKQHGPQFAKEMMGNHQRLAQSKHSAPMTKKSPHLLPPANPLHKAGPAPAPVKTGNAGKGGLFGTPDGTPKPISEPTAKLTEGDPRPVVTAKA